MEQGAVDNLIKAVCKKRDLSVSEVVSDRRIKKLVDARTELAHLLYHKCRLSIPKIAKILGRKDRTTILNLLGKEYKPSFNLTTEFGLNSPSFQLGIPVNIRYKKIFEKRGHKCQVCNFNDIIEVHHIVSPKIGGSLTDPENVILLCPNHHSMLHYGLISIAKLSVDN